MYCFQKILVATDLSKCARRALEYATDLAARTGATFFLLYVEDSRPDKEAWSDNKSARAEMGALERQEAALKGLFEAVAAEVSKTSGLPALPRDRFFVRVATGDPATEILSAAEDAHADLVVMGTHGRTTIKDFFVGSTTERVVERATCSVLTVKPEGYPYLRD